MSSLHLIHQYENQLNQAFPGLVAVLEEVARGGMTREDFIRRILNSLKDTSSFHNGIDSLSPHLRKQILDFIGGKSASAITMDKTKSPPLPQDDTPVGGESQLYESNGEPIKVPLPSFLLGQSS